MSSNMTESKLATPTHDLFGSSDRSVELVVLDQVIGSGYEKSVAKLAIEDGIAQHARTCRCIRPLC